MDQAALKAWRLRQRLTQKELAKLLGVTPMCVAFWEWGKRRIPPFLPLALEALEHRLKKGGSDGSARGVSGVTEAEERPGEGLQEMRLCPGQVLRPGLVD
jgi:DNA-binding XRE family transcriptional regulator